MDDNTLFVIVAVLVIAGLTAFLVYWYMRQRSVALRKHFGPEYERTVEETRDRRRAEAELEKRERRVKDLRLRVLTEPEQREFASEWKQIQARFVDEPSEAVADAERLLREVMRARGYPERDFEEQAADVSVHHPRLVQSYREAHAIAMRQQRGEAGTEDLRRAVVYYRALFEDLLESRRVA
jgi:hypothetical protein